jgi:hypothetical protein
MRKLAAVVTLLVLTAIAWWWSGGQRAPEPTPAPHSTAVVKPDPSWAAFFDGLAAQWEAEAKEIKKEKAQKPGGQKQ